MACLHPQSTDKQELELTGFNVGTGQFTRETEVDTNEFTLEHFKMAFRPWYGLT
jgi:hypothetical protein